MVVVVVVQSFSQSEHSKPITPLFKREHIQSIMTSFGAFLFLYINVSFICLKHVKEKKGNFQNVLSVLVFFVKESLFSN